MNRIFTTRQQRLATRAADGLPRWRWTVAEIEKMALDGYFREDERFELVGGEIVPMSPKGRRHEIIRTALAFHLTKQAPDGVFVAAETQFNLNDDTYLNPDILVHPAEVPPPDVRRAEALLVIEVADTSLHYDMNIKAPMYATYRRPAGKTWNSVTEAAPGTTLTSTLVPALSVSLTALNLKLE
jgi:Uma2 family endonuclease